MVNSTMIHTQDGRLSGVMVEANPINPAAARIEHIATGALNHLLCVAGDGLLFVTQGLHTVLQYTDAGGLTLLTSGDTPDAIETLQCTAMGAWIPPYWYTMYAFADSSSPTYQPSPTDYCASGGAVFTSGTFDGRYLWNINGINCVSRYDTTTHVGDSRLFDGYSSIIFDGTYVWLLPSGSSNIIRMESNSNWTYDTFPIPAAETRSYLNGVFVAPNSLYLIPSITNPGAIIVFNTVDHTSIALSGLHSSFTAAFDGQYIWFGAYKTKTLSVIDTADNTITSFGLHGDSAGACAFEGTAIYCASATSPRLIKIRTRRSANESDLSLVGAAGVAVIAAAAIVMKKVFFVLAHRCSTGKHPNN